MHGSINIPVVVTSVDDFVDVSVVDVFVLVGGIFVVGVGFVVGVVTVVVFSDILVVHVFVIVKT